MTLRYLLPLLELCTTGTAFQGSHIDITPRWSSRHSLPVARSTGGSIVDPGAGAEVNEIATIAPPRTIGADGLYAAERYVSTLRFLVPKDEEIAFEHRWAALATAETPGLRYFHVGKRGMDFMGPPLPDDEFNYQSFAVWESEAAHAACVAADFGAIARDYGGSPANYQGIFALSVTPAVSGVPAAAAGSPASPNDDKAKRLPREAFVASNRFGIKPGSERDFEALWAARDSSLADLPGFVNFQLLRREGPSDDDGNTYLSYTTWDSGKAFNNWRDSDNFKRSHANSGGGSKESPYAKMPKVVTFKTFLVASDVDGM